MTIRFHTAFYFLMMLLISVVIAGVYFDRPRPSANGAESDAPTAASDTYVPQPTDGPVTDAKLLPADQA